MKRGQRGEDADGKKVVEKKKNGYQITSARGKEKYCACATVYKNIKGVSFRGEFAPHSTLRRGERREKKKIKKNKQAMMWGILGGVAREGSKRKTKRAQQHAGRSAKNKRDCDANFQLLVDTDY